MLQKILEVSQGRRGGVLDYGDTQKQLVEQDVPSLLRPQEGEELVRYMQKDLSWVPPNLTLSRGRIWRKLKYWSFPRSRAAAEHRRSVAQELMMQ